MQAAAGGMGTEGGAGGPSPSRVVSVNVGVPRTVEWRGEAVRTGIFKSPVARPVHVGTLNLEGDGQADARVHGGPLKAVYLYPSEHYAFWRADLGALEYGAFGENLTTEGFAEATVHVGDRLRAGTAELIVTQPRLPCFKLGIRFGRPDVERRFLQSGFTGFYASVAREGDVRAGDALALVEPAADSVTIAEIVDLYRADHPDRALLQRLAALSVLPERLRERYRKQLSALDG